MNPILKYFLIIAVFFGLIIVITLRSMSLESHTEIVRPEQNSGHAEIDSLESLVRDLRFQRDHCYGTISSWNDKGYINPEIYRPRP